MLKLIKIAVGSVASIFLADVLGLGYSTAAGNKQKQEYAICEHMISDNMKYRIGNQSRQQESADSFDRDRNGLP